MLLLILFALSVLVRKNFIHKPLSNKAWVTAHTLTTVSIWQNEGPAKFYFTPVYTFSNQGDRNNGLLGGIKDVNDRYYYVSYPPLTFVAPYLYFSLTGTEASVIGLRYFNLLLHFVTAILLYSMLLLMVGKNWNNPFSLSALFVTMLYLFSSGTLFFHSEIFFADILVQPLFLAQLYFFMRWREERKRADFIKMLFFSFLAIYTEWLGLFTLFVFFIFVLCDRKITVKEKLLKSGMIGFITFFTLGLVIWQYIQVSGWDNLLEASINKFSVRSGHSGVDGSEYGLSFWNPESWKFLSGHMNGWFLPLINLTGILLPVWLLFMFISPIARITKRESALLLICILPILIHLITFFNFNVVHDMGSLKIMTLVMILLGLAIYKIVAVAYQKSKKWMYITASILMLLTGIKLYESIDRYQWKFAENQIGDYQLVFGETIKREATSDDVIFTNQFICPELMFYSKRNMYPAIDTLDWKNQIFSLAISSSLFIDTEDKEIRAVYQIRNGVITEIVK